MTLYDAMGGSTAVQSLVDDFYHRMQQDPRYARLLAVHPGDLARPRDRLFKYLSGWTGGPPLFESEFGHPRLRARHLQVAIDSEGRDQWLACMAEALQHCIADAQARAALWEALVPLADHMRNVPEG